MSWIDKVFINNLRCLLFSKYFAAYSSFIFFLNPICF